MDQKVVVIQWNEKYFWTLIFFFAKLDVLSSVEDYQYSGTINYLHHQSLDYKP